MYELRPVVCRRYGPERPTYFCVGKDTQRLGRIAFACEGKCPRNAVREAPVIGDEERRKWVQIYLHSHLVLLSQGREKESPRLPWIGAKFVEADGVARLVPNEHYDASKTARMLEL